MEYYSQEDLDQVVRRSAQVIATEVHPKGSLEIAGRSRGTPRIANRLLKRVRDFAQVQGDGTITQDLARQSLDLLGVDDMGLDQLDQKLLKMIITLYQGGPIGLNTLAANIGEEMETIEDMVEPFLLKAGLLNRTARGRVATQKAYDHFQLPNPDQGQDK